MKPMPRPMINEIGIRTLKISPAGKNVINLLRLVNSVVINEITFSYNTFSAHTGISEPIRPMSIPSIRNGALTKKSVAPRYFIIAISSCLTVIPIITVLLIRKTATPTRMMIIASET